LPLIATWQGSGGDAARGSLDRLSACPATHGEEVANVSSATGNAADEIAVIKSTLQRIHTCSSMRRRAMSTIARVEFEQGDQVDRVTPISLAMKRPS
jgi:hypothetical protein